MGEPGEDPHLSLTQEESKDQIEIEIFKRFCKASHLPVIAETIEHPKEPLPDIKCDLKGEGKVEFELMQLVGEFSHVAPHRDR